MDYGIGNTDQTISSKTGIPSKKKFRVSHCSRPLRRRNDIAVKVCKDDENEQIVVTTCADKR